MRFFELFTFLCVHCLNYCPLVFRRALLNPFRKPSLIQCRCCHLRKPSRLCEFCPMLAMLLQRRSTWKLTRKSWRPRPRVHEGDVEVFLHLKKPNQETSFTRKEASSDEPPVKRRQGGNDSDQCALTLLAASEELETGITASMMRSSKESCEPRHKRCFKNDPCILALTSATHALKVALTELKKNRQSCRFGNNFHS